MKINHNVTTGEIIEEELTSQDIAVNEILQKETEARKASLEKLATDKAALLDRLGITEDEAKLLLA
jgi:hypothetical protein